MSEDVENYVCYTIKTHPLNPVGSHLINATVPRYFEIIRLYEDHVVSHINLCWGLPRLVNSN